MSRYSFLVESYETERLKTLSVWSQFREEEMGFRPAPLARTPREHMVHQCVSEDNWMKRMLDVDLGEAPLPPIETKAEFIRRYADSSGRRAGILRERKDDWFEALTRFFEVDRSRSWIFLRRIAHSAQHRGQLTVYLRLLGHQLYSIYGPTADTGGLFQNQAPVIYRYPDLDALLAAGEEDGDGPALPGPGGKSPTERPEV